MTKDANRRNRENREAVNVQDILKKNLTPFSYGILQAVWEWLGEETNSSRAIFRCLQKPKMKVKTYAPNSVRFEVDGDVYRYAIYINDELYELCPIQVHKEEAEMRLQEIMNELWIEWNDESIYKEI